MTTRLPITRAEALRRYAAARDQGTEASPEVLAADLDFMVEALGLELAPEPRRPWWNERLRLSRSGGAVVTLDHDDRCPAVGRGIGMIPLHLNPENEAEILANRGGLIDSHNARLALSEYLAGALAELRAAFAIHEPHDSKRGACLRRVMEHLEDADAEAEVRS